MKIDRLLAIVIYLLSHQKVKAQELAEKFEVSPRTIYRDIEAISQAGIPIVTYQGGDGGIAIMDGYKLDKSMLSRGEILSIITGLKGVDSISPDIQTRQLIDKLSSIGGHPGISSRGPELVIDLSPWNKYDQLGILINDIKKAVQERRIIEFIYITGQNITRRRVEPYVIVFKQSNWYLYAFCLLRDDFRLFKLKRIYEMQMSDKIFSPRDYNLEEINWDDEPLYSQLEPVVLAFAPEIRYAVRDIFNPGSFEVMDDGRIKVSFPGQGNDWLYGFLLSFGDRVEVLSPTEVRDAVKSMAENIAAIYKKNLGSDYKMMTICGVDCSSCPLFQKECQGCVDGKPFWAAEFGGEDKVCPLYKCSKERNFDNCGHCEELPCQKWIEVRDPSYTDEEHQQSIDRRVAALRKKP